MSAAREGDGARLLDLVERAERGEETTAGPPDRPLDPEPEVIPGRARPVLDPAALYGPAGDFVRVVEPASEADPAALLVQLLTAVGSAANRSAYFQVEQTRHYLNINVLLMGRTSKARKGTSWDQVRSVLEQIDETWVRTCRAGGMSSGEGLIWRVRDPILKTVKVREKGRPARYEEQVEDPGITDKRLLVFQGEFASALRVMKRKDSTLSAVIRQAFDDGHLSSLTKNSPARATDAHISIIGHITAEELRREIEETDVVNGFLNRFLLVHVERSKCLPEGGTVDGKALMDVATSVQAGLDVARRGGELRRSPAARALWAEAYPGLSEGRPGMLGAVTGRAEAFVLRLSCLYAILDRSLLIGAEHLSAALVLWRYCEDSARFVFGDKLGDPTADAILGLLKSAPEGLTRTQISNAFDGHKEARELDRALGRLHELGLVSARKNESKGPNDGRPAVVYSHSSLLSRSQRNGVGSDSGGVSVVEGAKEAKELRTEGTPKTPDSSERSERSEETDWLQDLASREPPDLDEEPSEVGP